MNHKVLKNKIKFSEITSEIKKITGNHIILKVRLYSCVSKTNPRLKLVCAILSVIRINQIDNILHHTNKIAVFYIVVVLHETKGKYRCLNVTLRT